MRESDYELGEELIHQDNPKIQKIPSNKHLTWENMGLQMGDNGYPRANEHNAYIAISSHPHLQQLAWHDEFHQKIYTMNGDIKKEWGDHDDTMLARFVQGVIGLHSMKLTTIRSAFMEYCQKRVRNEPKTWLESLEWDGVERLPMFLSDCMDADENEYIRAVSQNLWIAMVARIYRPGCKYDNMIVLVGGQGTFKSTSLSIIGGQWYTEVHESVSNKDFFMALQGKLLVEIAEMDSFSKAETTKVKAIASCATDRYRAPFARTSKDHPRTCIFIGTTNEEQFLQDSTGGRRFWPVKVGKINTEMIKENRSQYFAEAVAKFKKGIPWHEVPLELAKKEQESRRINDGWETVIARALKFQRIDQITTAEILTDIIKMPIDRQGKYEQIRIGKVMRQLGWERKQRGAGEQRGEWFWEEKG